MSFARGQGGFRHGGLLSRVYGSTISDHDPQAPRAVMGREQPSHRKKSIDLLPISAAAYLIRRQRRRTPMVPPPQEPSNGAKGSSLLRLARRTFLRAARPKAGVSTARSEENVDDRPP